MRHRRVRTADHAVDDLVERAVAAAGVEADLLAGGGSLLRELPAVAGRLGDEQLILQAAGHKRGVDQLAVAFGAVRFSGGGIHNKNIEQAAPLKLHQLPYHTDRLALLRDVSVCYGGAPVCRGVSFCVEQGDRIALRGANGTGKTSLLRLLCGEDVPHTGTVERSSRLRISYVRQDPSGLRGDLGAYAARYGLDESLFKAILRKLDFARVQFEKDMADFSAGQKKKVLLARSLCEPSHLLVWDEPLNYVDVLSRMQIEDLLLEFQPTIVFVEHDRVFCDHVATKAVML